MGYDYGSTAKESVKGSAAGAAAGAVAGPWGALIGGAIGGTAYSIKDYWRQKHPGDGGNDGTQRTMLMDFYDEAMRRGDMQAGPAAQGAYSGFRENQSKLISRLEAMADGTGPSLAKQQFQQATDRNVRSQQAIAASGRGGPLAQLTQANNTAMLGANAAQGSALARTNEQMGAISQLGGVINQGRNSDEGVNMFNAGQTNQTALANLDARLRLMGLDDATRLSILQQMGTLNTRQAAQPTMTDQLMAGGASAASMYATQQAQARAAQGANQGSGRSAVDPSSTINPFAGQTGQNGGVTSPNQTGMFGNYTRPGGW